jgi:hypothetical protein
MTLPSSFWPGIRTAGHNDRVARWTSPAVAVFVAVLLTPGPASAHVPGQQIPDASFYRTEITDVVPAPAGVTVRVDHGGEWLELANAGAAAVVVLGYTGEPYLRITSNSAEENQLSQTTYLNRTLFADSVPTASAAGNVAPSWRPIGATGKARWHDHRIHWMGRARPPLVAADPTHPHLIGTWTVHAVADTTPFDVHGVLRWTGRPPGSSASPLQAWLLTLLASMTVVVGMMTIALIRARRRPTLKLALPADPLPPYPLPPDKARRPTNGAVARH